MNSFEEARKRAMESIAEEEAMAGENLPQSAQEEALQSDEGDAPYRNEASGAESPVSPDSDIQPSDDGDEGMPSQINEGSQQDAITEQAVQAAEQATMQMQQMQAQMQQMQAQMQQMAGQNQTLQETIRQMSEQHQAEVIEQATQNQPPSLDFASLAFDDEATATQKQQQYADAMTEYVRANLMRELDPLISESRAGMAAKEFENALINMENTPELAGASQLRPQLEQILSNNSVIAKSDASMEDKLIMAYAIARGVDAIQNPPKEPTADELFSKYQSNEDFRKLIEQDRLKKVKSQPEVPPFSAGGGAGNAALNIPDKPKTLEEAREAAKKRFM